MLSQYVQNQIKVIRGRRVILDSDLAALYGVPTKRLNEQIRRNPDRFPDDFMFQLNENEVDTLRSQTATSNARRGGRRYLPYAFTEHGALMAANVLNNPTAITVSIDIVRTFIQLRQILVAPQDLRRKLEALETKYDSQFRVVFDAVKRLMTPPEPKRRRIGIHSSDETDQ